jgi:hypothetical protein
MTKIMEKIKCPKCKRKVATYDGKTKLNIIARCRYCEVEVVYDVSTGKTRLGKPIVRNCSSGMRFS